MKSLKRKICFFVAFMMLFAPVLAACDVTPPADDLVIVSSIAFKESTIKTSYVQNETPDFTDLKVTITYADSTTEDVGLDDENLEVNTSAITTASVGTRTLRATYTDPVNDIKHNAPTLDITVTYNPAKFVKSLAFKDGTYSKYVDEGEDIVVSSIKLTATLEDGTTRELSANQVVFNNETINTDVPGKYTLTATYADAPNNGKLHVASVEIEVLESNPFDPSLAVEKVEFILAGVTTSFEADSEATTPTFSNLKLKATLANETTKEIERSAYSLNTTAVDMTKAGTYTIIATYVDSYNSNRVHTCTTNITVTDPPPPVVVEAKIESITGFVAGTYQSQYTVGDTFYLNSVSIAVVYDDETTGNIAYSSGIFTLNLVDFVNEGTNVIKNNVGTHNLVATIAVSEDIVGTTPLTAQVAIEIVAPYDPTPEQVKSVSLRAGSFLTVLEEGDSFVISGIILDIVLNNNVETFVRHPGFTVEVKVASTNAVVDDLTDMQQGTYTLTVTYADPKKPGTTFQATAEITVNEKFEIEATEYIYGYMLPQSMRNYTDNKSNTKSNPEEIFMDTTQHYEVGTNNTFLFFPEIEMYDNEDRPYVLQNTTADQNWTNEVTVQEITSAGALVGEILVSGAGLVTYHSDTGEFVFAEAAEGKYFRITQRIEDSRYAAWQSVADKVLEWDIKVVDGFNVYTANQFSVLDNSEDANSNRWQAFKEAHNSAMRTKYDAIHETEVYTVPVVSEGANKLDVNKVILHNNIQIAPENLPAGHFHTMALHEGSLRDNVNVYARNTYYNKTNNVPFELYGNYFNVDSSRIPLITYDTGSIGPDGFITANANLIGMGSYEEGNSGYSDKYGTNYVKTISFRGSTPRSNNIAFTGGIKMLEGIGETIIDNIIARDHNTFFLAHGSARARLDTSHAEYAPELFKVTRSKAYESASAMMFVWNHGNVVVDNCEFKRSGGPTFSMTDSDGPINLHEENMDTYPVVTVTNTEMEAILSGDEIWFQSGNAVPLAVQLKGVNGIFTGTEDNGLSALVGSTKTMLKTEISGGQTRTYANIYCIMMTQGIDGGAYLNNGKFTVDGFAVDLAAAWMSEGIAVTQAFAQGSPITSRAPVFSSSGGGLLAYTGIRTIPDTSTNAHSFVMPWDNDKIIANLGNHTLYLDATFLGGLFANNNSTYSAMMQEVAKLTSGNKLGLYYPITPTTTFGIMVESMGDPPQAG